MTRDETMVAVIRELEARGARVERSDFDPPGARLYSGRTQPFLDFILEDDHDYFEEEWFCLWSSCNPLPEYVIKAGKFVQGVISNELADSETTSLVFRERKDVQTTPEGIAAFVDWLLSYDKDAAIREAKASTAEASEASGAETQEPAPEELPQQDDQQRWNEKFKQLLSDQPTEFLIGMLIRHHMLPLYVDERKVQWMRDELQRRARENRWMDTDFQWHTGQHPYTRQQVIEAGYQFMSVRERKAQGERCLRDPDSRRSANLQLSRRMDK